MIDSIPRLSKVNKEGQTALLFVKSFSDTIYDLHGSCNITVIFVKTWLKWWQNRVGGQKVVYLFPGIEAL